MSVTCQAARIGDPQNFFRFTLIAEFLKTNFFHSRHILGVRVRVMVWVRVRVMVLVRVRVRAKQSVLCCYINFPNNLETHVSS